MITTSDRSKKWPWPLNRLSSKRICWQILPNLTREALQTLPAQLPIQAAIADHLCAAAAALNETETLRTGRWEVFLVKPTLVRLLDLWEATPAGEASTAQICQAVEHVRAYLAHPPSCQAEVGWGRDDLERPAWIDHSILAHACLLGVHSHRIWLPSSYL